MRIVIELDLTDLARLVSTPDADGEVTLRPLPDEEKGRPERPAQDIDAGAMGAATGPATSDPDGDSGGVDGGTAQDS